MLRYYLRVYLLLSLRRAHHTQTALAMTRTWHHVSARNAHLGRLACDVAKLLMGKSKPMYDQAVDLGDYVVVSAARHVEVTGKKATQKVYRHHTMFPGGLKTITFADMTRRKPDEVSCKDMLCGRMSECRPMPSPYRLQIIRKAVAGMLPKNKFRDRRLERLHIFPDDEHPYQQK